MCRVSKQIWLNLDFSVFANLEVVRMSLATFTLGSYNFLCEVILSRALMKTTYVFRICQLSSTITVLEGLR